MAARKSMVPSLPSLAQSSSRKFLSMASSCTAHSQLYRATAVDGGFTLTVPTAPNGTAPISGQTYVVLTGCNTTVSDDTVAAGPAAFEVGPL